MLLAHLDPECQTSGTLAYIPRLTVHNLKLESLFP